jgi:hypothetical protein
LGYLNTFKGQYYGALSSDPTLDPLGAAMNAGDLYWNTTASQMRVYDGAAWIAAYLPSSGYMDLTTAQTAAGVKTFSSNPILSGGTANTVPYLNGSKAIVTGSALTFDGTTFGISATGSFILPVGTTGQRPTGATGMLRFNSTTTQFEGNNGTTWTSVGGATLSNDTATATALYPLFASATSGSASTIYTSDSNYLYTPSLGELKTKSLVASNGIILNGGTMASSYTIAAGTNGFSVGPLTIKSGVTLTVTSGQRHVII